MDQLTLGSTPLCFDRLWFSMGVSVASGRFLEEEQELHLSLDMRANI